MRYKDSNGTNAYTFFLGDHLGSTTLTVLPNGTPAGKMLYKAFGEERYTYGTTPTDYRYTGQLEQSDIGLYYYGARWYDPAIGRFTQADTLIPQPGNPLDWDRYAYVRNSPVNYTDPSGQMACDGQNLNFDSCDQISKSDLSQLLRYQYSWTITNGNAWTRNSIEVLLQIGEKLSSTLGGNRMVSKLLGKVEFLIDKNIQHAGLGEARKVTLSSANFTVWTVVHELGHSLDGSSGWRLSRELETYTGGHTNKLLGLFKQIAGQCTNSALPGCNSAGYFYGGIPPKGADANFNRKEDFAESFAIYFYPELAVDFMKGRFERQKHPSLYASSPYGQSPRYLWIEELVRGKR